MLEYNNMLEWIKYLNETPISAGFKLFSEFIY